MTKKENVLELLKKEELTSTEVSEKLDYPIEIVWVYLNQFLKEKKIEVVRKESRNNIYKAVQKEDPITLLKQLYRIMIEYMKPIKELENTKKEILKTIGGMI